MYSLPSRRAPMLVCPASLGIGSWSPPRETAKENAMDRNKFLLVIVASMAIALFSGCSQPDVTALVAKADKAEAATSLANAQRDKAIAELNAERGKFTAMSARAEAAEAKLAAANKAVGELQARVSRLRSANSVAKIKLERDAEILAKAEGAKRLQRR